MISINNKKGGYVLDLNEEPYSEHEMTISSKGERNKNLPWAVDMVSNPDVITASTVGKNTLKIEEDMPNVLSEEYVILKNMRNDTARITIIPNSFYTMEKNYEFEIKDKEFKDGSLKIDILSTMNGEDASWKCTYNGKPMEYFITPSSSNSGGIITIEPCVNVISDFIALVEFTQDLSGNKIELLIYNTKDGVVEKAD